MNIEYKLALLRQRHVEATRAVEFAIADKTLIEAEIQSLLLLLAEVKAEREITLFYSTKEI